MHSQIQAAIDAANAGDKVHAFEIINQVLVQDSRNVEAWLMLAALTEDEESKVKYLQRVLVLEPQNQIAREELVEMKRAVSPLPATPKPNNARQAAPLSLVQAAIDAIKAGNKPKALEYLKQRLQENPNDVEAWLVMPSLVDDLGRKRQYLQVALGIDPNNKIARERLTEVERAGAMAAPPSYVNQTATPTSAASYTTTQTVMPSAASAPAKKPAPQVYKFTYPIVMKFIVYAMLVGALILLFSGLAGQMGEYCWPLSLVVVAGAWVVSVRVEIDASEVRVVQLFIRKALKWDDITSLRTGVQRYHLQLIGAGGKSLKINSQVEGYENILALIRHRRPDLFSEMGTDKTFSDYRVFKKPLIKYVAVVFGVILVFLGMPVFWAPTANDRIGFLVLIAIGLYLIIVPLLGVRQIKVEPGILTLDWMFRNEEYRPQHIENIYLANFRGRYGAVHHHVVIKPQDEKAIQLNDFGGDTDTLYGVLMNWWKSGRQ